MAVADEVQAYVIAQINIGMDQRFGSFTTAPGSQYAALIDQTGHIDGMRQQIVELQGAIKVIDGSISTMQGDLQKVMPDMDAKLILLNKAGRRARQALLRLTLATGRLAPSSPRTSPRLTYSFPS